MGTIYMWSKSQFWLSCKFVKIIRHCVYVLRFTLVASTCLVPDDKNLLSLNLTTTEDHH